MKPATPDTPDLVLRLRQQLILAQVRIMELEDARETLTPRVADLEKLRQAAQAIADDKIAEAAHLGQVLAETRRQRAELESAAGATAQHLDSARAALADAKARLAAESAAVARLQAELEGIKASRSWRWTAWWRALGGASGRSP
jgi:chromosome segregation ATPase